MPHLPFPPAHLPDTRPKCRLVKRRVHYEPGQKGRTPGEGFRPRVISRQILEYRPCFVGNGAIENGLIFPSCSQGPIGKVGSADLVSCAGQGDKGAPGQYQIDEVSGLQGDRAVCRLCRGQEEAGKVALGIVSQREEGSTLFITGTAGCGLSCKKERCMPLHDTRRRGGYGDSGKTDFDGVWCACT